MRIPLALLILLCSAACDRDDGTDEPVPPPVSVYVSYQELPELDALFSRFTQDTGARVSIKTGEPELIVDAVIGNNGSPPADLLLADDVSRIWRAAEEGGLRAMRSDVVDAAVAPRLRDPDHLWFGVGFRAAAIAVDAQVLDPGTVTEYAALAEDRVNGRLCLSSSSLPVNRSLMAMLIADLGVRPTEILVRRWKANLSIPVLQSETALLEAMEAGRCQVGVVSSTAFESHVRANKSSALRLAELNEVHINVEAAGVARHARNPEGAQRLIEWLITQTPLGDGDLDGVSNRNVGIAGWHNEDAVKLAERAGYP